MTLLALLASASGGSQPPDPDPPTPGAFDARADDPAAVLPYAMPTAAPYNAPTYCGTPTADGTGSTVHPGVVDMGPGNTWQGYRYWMAVTGYYNTDDRQENPHILVSQNGYWWRPPPGLTRIPLYAAPPEPRFNSDTDIEYDADNDRMVLIYREQQADTTQQTFIATSTDGITWPTTATALDWDRPNGNGQIVSPAIIRRGPGDWWIFGLGRDSLKLYAWQASDPLGRWHNGAGVSGYRDLGWPQLQVAETGDKPWHLDVTWDGGKFRALLDLGPRYMGNSDGYRVGTSDGTGAFTWAPGHVMDLAPSGWDDIELYRATLTPHENGTHYRVWYSAEGDDSWRTGLTLLPKSLWPA